MLNILQTSNFGNSILRCGNLSGIYDFRQHIHQSVEIVYVRRGEMIATVDGEEKIMRAGDIAVIAPFRLHGFHTPEFVDRWICVFSGNYLAHFLSEEELYGTADNFVFHASPALIAFMEERMPDSGEEYIVPTPPVVRTIKTLLCAIYESYLREVKIEPQRRDKRALPAILLHIARHYREPISLASIGAALGYSPKYVSLCIGTLDNMNLCSLVNSFRADFAKELLITTDLRVIDIAMESGYASEKSFHRAFRQTTGMTPGEYRNQKRFSGRNAPN